MMFTEEPKWEVFTDFRSRLSPGEIHLFRINVEEWYPKIEDYYKEILSAEELDRASRFFFPKDRNGYIARRYFLRKILSCFLSSSPQDLEYSTVGNKKPTTSGIAFNVSHSNKYAVVAVHCNPLGVDVEYLDPEFDFKSILNSGFHVEERAFLSRSITATDSGIATGSAAFYALWTRKEALLKATAEGLNDDVGQIDCLANEVSRMGNLYSLRTFQIGEHYILSLATTDVFDNFRYWQV
jgi:4'-phosphopantetheinyl transferase